MFAFQIRDSAVFGLLFSPDSDDLEVTGYRSPQLEGMFQSECEGV